MIGRRWARTARECPEWCAKDHRCTARHGYPSGQHRSAPLVWRTPYGALTTVRVQEMDGRQHLDVSSSVDLDADPGVGRWQAQHLAVGIDLTVRAVLRGPLARGVA